MFFLAGEICLCLILAWIVGIFTGWTLRGVQTRRSLKNLENVYRINMASLNSKKHIR